MGKRPPVGTGKFDLFLDVNMLKNEVTLPEFVVEKPRLYAPKNEKVSFVFHPPTQEMESEFAPSSPCSMSLNSYVPPSPIRE